MMARKTQPGKIPPRSTQLQELLADCADVMDAPAYAPGFDLQHLNRLAEAMDQPESPEDHELLQAVYFALRSQMFVNSDPAGKAFHVRRANRLAVDLKTVLEGRGVPSYLYHGTLSGNLGSIRGKGLIPGCKPVWTSSEELRALAEDVVFFSDTWRGASFFANAALEHRGAEEGYPVVIRVPEKGLTQEEDPFAFVAGCTTVRGVVSTGQADVFLGPLEGYPKWRPLSEVVGKM